MPLSLPRIPWPWSRPSIATPKTVDPAFEHDRQALMQDIQQMKRVNQYLLSKAIARGWITDEAAEAIRTTQSYENEGKNVGPQSTA